MIRPAVTRCADEKPRRPCFRRLAGLVPLAGLFILLSLPAHAGQLEDSGAAVTAAEAGGSGDIGIIGTLAGFGSLKVNGLVVDHDADVAVYSQLGRSSASELRRGQVLAIEAEETENGLRARRIEVRQIVAGPLQAVDPEGRWVRLLGQQVEMDPSVQFGGALRYAPLSSLTSGDYLEVSGYRRPDGTIVATRVDRFLSGGPALLEGQVTAVDGRRLEVEGQPVEFPDRRASEGVEIGDRISVRGEMAGERLLTGRVVERPRIPFAGRLRRVSIEGFAAPSIQPALLNLHGMEFQQVGFKDGGFAVERRLVVSGRLDQGSRLEVAKLEPAEFRVTPSPLRSSRKVNRLDRQSPDRDLGLLRTPSRDSGSRSRVGHSGRSGKTETTLQRYQSDRRVRRERQKIDLRRRQVRRSRKSN